MADSKLDRNDEPKEITKVGGGIMQSMGDAPSWIAEFAEEDQGASLEAVREYRKLSRVKVIQGTSSSELVERFGAGSAVLTPDMQVLCRKGEEGFLFVPCLFFTEWTVQNDIDDKESPFIQDRTFNKESEIARKARDRELRVENYGPTGKNEIGKFERRYVEHLCFTGMIYDDTHDCFGRPFCLSFEKGEFGKGTQFSTAVSNRRIAGKLVPLYLQVWNFRPGFREEGSRKWWGMDFYNPVPDKLYVSKGDGVTMREWHNTLKQELADERLRVDYNADTDYVDGENIKQASAEVHDAEL